MFLVRTTRFKTVKGTIQGGYGNGRVFQENSSILLFSMFLVKEINFRARKASFGIFRHSHKYKISLQKCPDHTSKTLSPKWGTGLRRSRLVTV